MSLQAQLDRILPEPPEPKPEPRVEHLRILLLDIETYPGLTWVWSLWDKFTPVERVAAEGGLLSCAWKWYGEDTTHFGAHWTDGGYAKLVNDLHAALCEADAVVTYNGDRFDLPKLRTYVELESGMGPVSPFQSIDLYHAAKRVAAGYLSKKLGYLCERLEVGHKVSTGGFDLWIGAMPPELGGRGDPESQAHMETYNRGDVADTLEPLYDALLPWIKAHPHVGLYDESGVNRCQRCGRSDTLVRNGMAYTPLGQFQRWQCDRAVGGCGSWSRGRHKVATVDARSIG